jgi:hypothetical protein
MTNLITYFHRKGVTAQIVRPAIRQQIAASGMHGTLEQHDGSLIALWQLRPLRNGCGLLAFRRIAVPAELWCAACDALHMRRACACDDDGATLRYTCRATGALLGEF